FRAEQFPQNSVVDERQDIAVFLKSNAALRKLTGMDGKGRSEVAEDALDSVDRNAPNAEEAQDVVDPESIEVATQLSEALFPPREPGLLHQRPVVGGEAPVLAFFGERVGGGTCLDVHMVELRTLPGIGAIPIDSYREISLQDHAVRMRVMR